MRQQERAQLRRLRAEATQLAGRWRLVLGKPYRASPVSLVIPAERADGLPTVLKIPIPDEENCREADALQTYAGDGAVWLYDADPESGALLLERLEPGTPLADHPDRAEAIKIICGLLRRLRRPPGPAHSFPLLRELALRWAEELPAMHARHGWPSEGPLVARATALARDLAVPDGDELLVNRDAHLGNVLAGQRMPWLLIDPKPLVGDRAFDAGWPLLELLSDEPTAAHARWLVARLCADLELDPARVCGWAFVRAVETALGLLELGEDPGDDFALAAAIGALA